jgi:UDP-N-acetylglucosamine--N-acetylmuramyl-(pentapeptide) pyrophosphoryl-undecaprenol N-acetylglucosamine transferase
VTTYLMAGGGTAGHVNPLLAVADRLRERDPSVEVLVLGTQEGLESRLVPERGYELLTIPRLPFPRRPNRAALSFPKRFTASIDRVRAIISDRGVDAVVGFGGYASAPAYVAAHREGVPLAIHEANARPGIANRLGARYTRYVGVAFPGTRLRGAIVVGMPLRREIERLDRFAGRREGVREFQLEAERPTLLVTGGSSGALRINRTISASIVTILGTGWQVLHITGANFDGDDPRLPGYRMLPYGNRMDLALAVADLAVSRAGSATVAELAALGVPAVFVPYATGNGEQRLNARGMVEAGGALLVDDARFTPEWVTEELVPLLLSRARIADMAARAATTGALDGSDRMADLVQRAVARA